MEEKTPTLCSKISHVLLLFYIGAEINGNFNSQGAGITQLCSSEQANLMTSRSNLRM